MILFNQINIDLSTSSSFPPPHWGEGAGEGVNPPFALRCFFRSTISLDNTKYCGSFSHKWRSTWRLRI